MVESSRAEILNSVEFYNRPGGRRPLEAFLVHAHIAWLYLLQAEFSRDKVNYYYRDPKNPRRYLRVDGERKAWELATCIKRRWTDKNDPIRQNLELTVRLRNRIEHRYEEAMMVAATGFVQALILNFEEEIVSQFGASYSIAKQVHMPVSLSAYTREGVARLAAAQQSLPKRLQDFFVDYRAGLNIDIINDRRFELRIELVQKAAPKTQADLAVSFVREDELPEEQRKAYETLERTGRIILRDKERPVSNLGLMRPKQACAAIEAEIPFRFSHSSDFPRAWRYFKARPPAAAKDKFKTDERYCCYDEAHNDYVYTQAFVNLIIKECGTEEGFMKVIGRKPRVR